MGMEQASDHHRQAALAMARAFTPDLHLVIDRHDHVGETPVWSDARQGLFWVNCEQPPRLQFWGASSGEYQSWPLTQRLGGYVLKQSGNALLALADGLYDFDLQTGALSRRVPNHLEHASLHECRCDVRGRFWVGSIDRRVGPGNFEPKGGALHRLDGDRLVEVLTGITCSNGLAFSPDGDTLYHSDSTSRTVKAWRVDASTGRLGDERVFVRLNESEGFCDGATVDADGCYWMTLVYAGKIRKYLPSGELDLEMRLPFSNPTNVAFGGPHRSTLYITTTRLSIGTPLSGESMLGALYSTEVGSVGLPEPMLHE